MRFRSVLCGTAILVGACSAEPGQSSNGGGGSTTAGGSGGTITGGSGGVSTGGTAGTGGVSTGGMAGTGGGSGGQGGSVGCAPGVASACYEGPDGTLGVGSCAGGQHVCNADGMSFGPCEGQVLPAQEECDLVDNNCNGKVDEDLRRDCTLNECSPGFQLCTDGIWGVCTTPTVSIDPSPEATQPGEYGCAGCPDTGTMVFSQDFGAATATTFSGTVTGAVGDGKLYLESALGERFLATVPTDPVTGAYTITAPLFCGAQTLKLVWNNGAGKYTLVEALTTSGCTATDLRATITWDALGDDWELHLIKPGGHINDDATDCTWTSCISQSPDWGVVGDSSDNPKKDVDNTNAFGPENIWLNKPEMGIYTVMVEHWGFGDPGSDGSAFVNIRGAVYEVDIQDLAPKHVWTVGTIEMPCGVFTPSMDIHDCSANWVGGCRDAIP